MKWISVNDKLPEDNSDVLVIIFDRNEYYVPFTTKYKKRKFWNEFEDTERGIDPYHHLVSHWMYLPEPPSKQKINNEKSYITKNS
jgi:hypothetical protein